MKDGSGYTSKNASFIHGQVQNSKIKKGTKLHLVGRLVQERWRQDDANRSRIVIVAEHAAYAATGGTGTAKTGEATSSPSTSVPDSF
jgi:single-stranded DNA-binding protein